MPRGYNLDPELQRKIEDERAGRLDYVYETALSVEDAIKRVGRTVPTKLSSYEFKRENGILYIIFTDNSVPNDGLHYIKPMKYALRFESEGESTVIRVRYIWEYGPGNDQYLFPGDVNDFFCKLFDAKVSDLPKKIWIDGTNAAVANDPLHIHGSKHFWIIFALFVIIWLIGMTIGFMQ